MFHPPRPSSCEATPPTSPWFTRQLQDSGLDVDLGDIVSVVGTPVTQRQVLSLDPDHSSIPNALLLSIGDVIIVKGESEATRICVVLVLIKTSNDPNGWAIILNDKSMHHPRKDSLSSFAILETTDHLEARAEGQGEEPASIPPMVKLTSFVPNFPIERLDTRTFEDFCFKGRLLQNFPQLLYATVCALLTDFPPIHSKSTVSHQSIKADDRINSDIRQVSPSEVSSTGVSPSEVSSTGVFSSVVSSSGVFPSGGLSCKALQPSDVSSTGVLTSLDSSCNIPQLLKLNHSLGRSETEEPTPAPSMHQLMKVTNKRQKCSHERNDTDSRLSPMRTQARCEQDPPGIVRLHLRVLPSQAPSNTMNADAESDGTEIVNQEKSSTLSDPLRPDIPSSTSTSTSTTSSTETTPAADESTRDSDLPQYYLHRRTISQSGRQPNSPAAGAVEDTVTGHTCTTRTITAASDSSSEPLVQPKADGSPGHHTTCSNSFHSPTRGHSDDKKSIMPQDRRPLNRQSTRLSAKRPAPAQSTTPAKKKVAPRNINDLKAAKQIEGGNPRMTLNTALSNICERNNCDPPLPLSNNIYHCAQCQHLIDNVEVLFPHEPLTAASVKHYVLLEQDSLSLKLRKTELRKRANKRTILDSLPDPGLLAEHLMKTCHPAMFELKGTDNKVQHLWHPYYIETSTSFAGPKLTDDDFARCMASLSMCHIATGTSKQQVDLSLDAFAHSYWKADEEEKGAVLQRFIEDHFTTTRGYIRGSMITKQSESIGKSLATALKASMIAASYYEEARPKLEAAAGEIMENCGKDYVAAVARLRRAHDDYEKYPIEETKKRSAPIKKGRRSHPRSKGYIEFLSFLHDRLQDFKQDSNNVRNDKAKKEFSERILFWVEWHEKNMKIGRDRCQGLMKNDPKRAFQLVKLVFKGSWYEKTAVYEPPEGEPYSSNYDMYLRARLSRLVDKWEAL